MYKVKKSNNVLNNMNDFEKIALVSENNPVEYFSTVDPHLFLKIIEKFKMNHTMNHK
nr:COX aromatic rich motif-containing protein [Candidatus Pantoea edessiphila]